MGLALSRQECRASGAGFVVLSPTQRFRAGLTHAAPPALEPKLDQQPSFLRSLKTTLSQGKVRVFHSEHIAHRKMEQSDAPALSRSLESAISDSWPPLPPGLHGWAASSCAGSTPQSRERFG